MSIFGWSLPAGCNNVNLPGEEDFDDSIPEELVTQAQWDEINNLTEQFNDFKKKNNLKTMPFKMVFGDNIPAGTFKWDNDDPGDAFAYKCGEKDCETGWHIAYWNDILGRKDGKLYIETIQGDESGNWETTDYWEEGEDPTEILGILAQRMDDYFIGWGYYWLYCAKNAREILEAGKDPLEQVIRLSEIKAEELVEFFLASAREDINYLKM